MSHPIHTIYVDGGVIARNPSHVGGTWAAVAADALGLVLWERAGVLPVASWGVYDPKSGRVTIENNVTELFAVVRALELAPPGWSGRVRSDSLNAIRRARDPKDAKMNGVPLLLHRRLVEATARCGAVEYELLCGHPTRQELATGVGKRGYPVHALNVRCDFLCGVEAEAYMQSLTPSEADDGPDEPDRHHEPVLGGEGG